MSGQLITSEGIFPDFPVNDYFDDPCPEPSLTQSLCKIILDQSPLHAKFAHPRLGTKFDNSEDYEKNMAIGNAIHAILLGRGKHVAVGNFNDWRTKASQEWKTAALEAGETPILAKHWDRADFACRSIRKQLDTIPGHKPLTDGESEVVIAWKEQGFWFRSMIDYVSSGNCRLEDLKSTSGSVSPSAIPFMMSDSGWAVQAALQDRGLNKLDPANAGRRRFRFLAIENREPYGLTINELSESVMTVGRRMVDLAIRIWKQCMASDVWPCYPIETNYPDVPVFKLTVWEEQERRLKEIYQLTDDKI